MAMRSNYYTVGLSFMLVLMMGGFVSSDISKDREECANQLVGLAPCLPFVGGDAKAPPSGCCTGLKPVLDKSKKCLCVLIKDRNDPSLGLKINATLAMSLPAACHTPTNISECSTLLHLKPNSPEAKVFEQFDNNSNGSTGTPDGKPESSNGTSSNDQEKSGGDRGHRWLGVEKVCGVLLWCFTLIFLDL